MRCEAIPHSALCDTCTALRAQRAWRSAGEHPQRVLPVGEEKPSQQKGDSSESPFCLLTTAVRVWTPIGQVDSAGGLSTVDDEGLHRKA